MDIWNTSYGAERPEAVAMAYNDDNEANKS